MDSEKVGHCGNPLGYGIENLDICPIHYASILDKGLPPVQILFIKFKDQIVRTRSWPPLADAKHS